MTAPVNIIIPWFISPVEEDRQLRICTKCIEGIRKFVHMDYNLTIVDNGATPRASEWAWKSNPEFYIRVPYKAGLTHALNIGIRASFSPYVFYLNADNIVSEGTVEKMHQALVDNPELACVGAPWTEHVDRNYVYRHPSKPEVHEDIYQLFDPSNTGSFDLNAWNTHAQEFAKRSTEMFRPGLFAGVWMSPRKVYEEMGYSPVFTNHGRTWHDTDTIMGNYLDMKGKKYGCVMNTLIYHPRGGRTTTMQQGGGIPEDTAKRVAKDGTRVVDADINELKEWPYGY